MRFTVGFLMAGWGAEVGNIKIGIAFAAGVVLGTGFLDAWVMIFLMVVEPLWASIMI